MSREEIIAKFLAALGGTNWDIRAVKRETDGTVANHAWTWDTATFPAHIKQLSLMNFKGCDVYCRPLPEDGLFPWVFVDDVAEARLDTLKKENPCVVLKSSPGNLQAWFRLDAPVSRERAIEIRRDLATRFGGDMASAANPELVGRVPSFTNRKPKHKRPDGTFPLVVAVWFGKKYLTPSAIARVVAPPAVKSPIAPKGTDRSREDWKNACWWAEQGKDAETIAVWLEALSEKGRDRPDYCRLTAEKAVTHVRGKLQRYLAKAGIRL